jgi:hypothetical protein
MDGMYNTKSVKKSAHISLGNIKERYRVGDLDVDVRIIIKCTLEK